MASSTQITEKINNAPNPEEMEFKIWQQTRYLVAQKPAAESYSETVDGYYNGRMVIPGPKGNKALAGALSDYDLNIVKNQHFIRFVDNKVTENATGDISRALYTPMTKIEADDYEATLRRIKNVDPEPTSVHSETA